MNVMTKHRSQAGFSAIEAMIGIVIISLIAGSLLIVSLKKQSPDTGKNNKTTQQAATSQTTPSASDYATYTNAALGFSFAYPKDWGTVTVDGDATTAPATGGTPQIKDVKKYPFYYGNLNFTVNPKASFQMTGQKNGATYVPILKNSYNNYVWKIVAVNPADTIDKIGDIYSAPIINSTTGVQLYDFNWSDEGHTTKRWTFETKAGFVVLSLPSFGSNDNPPTAAQAAINESIANAISKSVQLIY